MVLMDCPGEYLKRERELREVSLDDISNKIRVPVKLLKALEADDYQSLPHTTFVKGFIKAYCKFLGVDENDALLRYELYLQEIAEFEEPTKKSKSLDVEERYYPVRQYLKLVLVAVGVIIIVGVYYLRSTSEDAADKDTSAEVLEKLGPEQSSVKVEDKALELKREVSEAALQRAERIAQEPVAPVLFKVESTVKIDVESDAISPAEPEVAVREDSAPREIVTPEVILPALKPEDLASKGLPPGEHVLRAHARELTWMKVEIDSNEPFEIMLQPGEKAEWKGKVFFYS